MLCLLQSWRLQLAALPGQTMRKAQNTESITSHLLFQTCIVHICKLIDSQTIIAWCLRCASQVKRSVLPGCLKIFYVFRFINLAPFIFISIFNDFTEERHWQLTDTATIRKRNDAFVTLLWINKHSFRASC